MFFFLVVSLVNYDKRISEIPRQIFCVSLETFIALKPKLFSKATVALLIYVSKSSGICLSDVNLCRTVVKKRLIAGYVRLDGQIVWEKFARFGLHIVYLPTLTPAG